MNNLQAAIGITVFTTVLTAATLLPDENKTSCYFENILTTVGLVCVLLQSYLSYRILTCASINRKRLYTLLILLMALVVATFFLLFLQNC